MGIGFSAFWKKNKFRNFSPKFEYIAFENVKELEKLGNKSEKYFFKEDIKK